MSFSQRRQWHPTPALLPGKFHGQRSLVGCSPWGRQESDMTEWFHFDFSLSCIGEGNGNPVRCSCLENPRDREPGGLLSMWSHRVGHDWGDLAAACKVWELDYKAEHRRIDAFELWCWRRFLRVPWTARRSNQSILKEISPGCSLEDLMSKLKLQ